MTVCELAWRICVLVGGATVGSIPFAATAFYVWLTGVDLSDPPEGFDVAYLLSTLAFVIGVIAGVIGFAAAKRTC